MGASQEKCIRTLSVVVEPLDQDGGAVQGIGSARDVVEDVGKGANFLRDRSWSLFKGLSWLLLRSATHSSFFPLAANLKKIFSQSCFEGAVGATLSRTAWMISFLLVASCVALALCSCWTTAVQERIPMQSSPNRQSSLTESGGEEGVSQEKICRLSCSGDVGFGNVFFSKI